MFYIQIAVQLNSAPNSALRRGSAFGRCQVDIQGYPIPETEFFLSFDPLRAVCELQIELEDDTRQNDAHLSVG